MAQSEEVIESKAGGYSALQTDLSVWMVPITGNHTRGTGSIVLPGSTTPRQSVWIGSSWQEL